MNAGPAISFDVIGSPSPQGSKRSIGNNVFIETSKGLKPWRNAVAAQARVEMGRMLPLSGPLHLTVQFRFPMPQSRPAAIRRAGLGPKTTTPDLDKLVRAVGDALKEGGMVRDDALFCELTASKVEVDGWSGASVTVSYSDVGAPDSVGGA